MSLTYAIGDLHGRLDLLAAAFERISRHVAGRPFKIITLGDYIDRGPQSRQIIEHLMAGQLAGLPLICLKGNHEDMMVETIRKPLPPAWWVGNGGGATLVSYGHAREGVYKPDIVPQAHLNWLDALPTKYVDQHRVFVHAGVDPAVSLDDQKQEVLLWWIYPDRHPGGHGERHVVHGHEKSKHGPLLFKSRTNLDVFAWYTGRIVVGVFDDAVPGGPVDILNVVIPKSSGVPA